MKKTLQEWRELRGYSRQQLAEKAGSTRQSIYNYETIGLGGLNVHTLTDILLALDITFDQLELKFKEEER